MTRHFMLALIITLSTSPCASAQTIAVETERTRERALDAPNHYDRPIYEMRASATVQTSDLDLDTPAGQGELRRRIHVAAIESCHAIDTATADTLIDDEFTCIRRATRDAERQLARN